MEVEQSIGETLTKYCCYFGCSDND